MKLLLSATCCLLLLLLPLIDSARILMLAPFGSKSHKNSYVPLLGELARRGHDITYFTNYETSEFRQIPNIKEIVIPELKLESIGFSVASVKNALENGETLGQKLATMQHMFNFPLMIAEKTYRHPAIKQMLAEDSFDLVLMTQFAGAPYYPFAWHFKVPFIIISPAMLFPGLAPALGDSDHTEQVPLMFPFPVPMSFMHRLIITVFVNFFTYFNAWNRPTVHAMAQEIIPGCPPLDEIEKNVSLVMTASHPVFYHARTQPPQVIEIGALHCRPGRPLPSDLEEFIAGSGDAGFIIFAVGSVAKMDELPEHVIKAFMKSFEQLPQRVIWQWKGTPRADLPSNVLPIDWLPQQDLLAHEKCKLFLTHGGMNSLNEAVYHGVPILGMPIGLDQYANLALAAERGYAIHLDWKDINEKTLSEALRKLLTDPKYLNKAKELSSLLLHQPQTPLERAAFYTEFVLRHNGADLLRLGSRHLASYQKALLDVYGVILLAVLTPFILFAVIVRNCCCSTNKKKTTASGANKEKQKALQKKKQ